MLNIRTGVCPIGITVDEVVLSIVSLRKGCGGKYTFNRAVFCVTDLFAVAKFLDTILDHAQKVADQMEVEAFALSTCMRSLSLETSDMVVAKSPVMKRLDTIEQRLEVGLNDFRMQVCTLERRPEAELQ